MTVRFRGLVLPASTLLCLGMLVGGFPVKAYARGGTANMWNVSSNRLLLSDAHEAPPQEGASGHGPRGEAFLNWIFGTSDEAPPQGGADGHGPRGDTYCIVSLPTDQVTPLWSDRPVFLIEGSPRSLALFAENSDQPIWTYPVNQQQAVTYDGPWLRPGQVYTLHAQHHDFPSSIFEARQIELLSLERQVEIAWALLGMGGADGSSVDQALARADYFWAEGLEADAWREVAAVQAESEVAAEAIATATDRFCNSSSN
ncbi:MAG: hypothetical protein O2890_02015 [Cyanobacteria bacterium]|nr:hypothetical protein [Cyanobacteriota bacterium]MDA0865192.1 hypothetical protein [Cyanobacteriota bacterium]